MRGKTNLATVVLLTALAGTIAATPISSAFDGSYAGTLSPIGALSTGNCAAVPAYSVSIAKGILTAVAPMGNGNFRALVTADGFVTGRVSMTNGKVHRVEGRITNGTFLAGMFTDDNRCAWLVTLSKAG